MSGPEYHAGAISVDSGHSAVACPNCHGIVTYTSEDIRIYTKKGWGTNTKYECSVINCPNCNGEILLYACFPLDERGEEES